MTPTDYPQADAITRFTRGLGLARSHDVAGARREIEALEALRRALTASGEAYWADRTGEQILAVSAWIALADGAKDTAVDRRCAAPPTARTRASRTSRWRTACIRCASCSATCCSRRGSHRRRCASMRPPWSNTPNRYRGLYGAAVAAQAAGDKAAAAEYFTKLVALAKSADTERPELARARAFLAER